VAVQRKNQLGFTAIGASLAIIGTSFLMQTPEYLGDTSDALVNVSLPPEMSKLPGLFFFKINVGLSLQAYEACTFQYSSDGNNPCDKLAEFTVRPYTGQVCIRVPTRDYIWREVRNSEVEKIQEAIRKRAGLSLAQYEQMKVPCG
jgi:hypothetical protein